MISQGKRKPFRWGEEGGSFNSNLEAGGFT